MGFPDQLKKARLTMKYTQQQVADLIGITKSTYCGYETGKRQPDVAKIKQLASVLNTSGDTLLETGFGNTNSDLNIDDLSKSELTEDESELLGAWREATDAAKESALMVLKSNKRLIVKKEKAM